MRYGVICFLLFNLTLLTACELLPRDIFPHDFDPLYDTKQQIKPEINKNEINRGKKYSGESIWEVETWEPNISEEVQDNLEPRNGFSETRIPVLCYHKNFSSEKSFNSFNVSPKMLNRQLKYLYDNGYRTISLEQMYRIIMGLLVNDLPARPVLITFDDGAISNYTVALEALKKYQFTGVLFLYPAIISSSRKSYMRWWHVRKLAQSGVFEIGSHTYWHPRLPEMTITEIRYQLKKSKSILERRLGIKVLDLAYPFGLYDRRIINELKKAGYRMAFTINRGDNHPGDDPFTLNRYMVGKNHSLSLFIKNLKLRTPAKLTVFPFDGSHVFAGQKIRFYIPGIEPDSISVKLGVKRIKINHSMGTYSGYLPAGGRRRYLILQLRARDHEGDGLFRQFLYLNGTRFRGF